MFYTRHGLVWSVFYTAVVWSGLVWSVFYTQPWVEAIASPLKGLISALCLPIARPPAWTLYGLVWSVFYTPTVSLRQLRTLRAVRTHSSAVVCGLVHVHGLVCDLYSGLQNSCNFQKSKKRSFPVFPLIFQVLHMRSIVFRFFDLQLCKPLYSTSNHRHYN